MGRRLLWMVGLYLAGIAAVGAVALVLRLLMTAAGMTA
ncbi:MAG TPA: DUF2474 family protein [Rhodopila sp.]|nr:DUF2474 family protein [Rhodopila sp.]